MYTLNYGMGVASLARRLKCSRAEAKDKMVKYLETYPAIKRFYKSAKEETRRTGYAYTVLGRRRALPGINSRYNGVRADAERKAVNTRIQGSAADVVKMAQIMCHASRFDRKYGCEMLLQIHDELVFECPTENVERAMKDIVGTMEHPFPTDLAVAMGVDAGTGQTWAEGH